jgi:large subunit ribosomal protein L17
MRHLNSGKQLSRDTDHRKALRRNLALSLFEHGSIRTTVVKAKEIKPFVERLITLARKNTLTARRRVRSILTDRGMADKKALKEGREEMLEQTVVQKLFSEIAPRYAARPGGYTRIIRLPERRIGDAGKQVLLQLVEEKSVAAEGSSGTTSARRKRAGKRVEDARKALAEAGQAAPAAAQGSSQVQT